MEQENSQDKTMEPIFPEETGLIIRKILEKYGLAESQKEGIEKFIASENPREKREIFENLPGKKIAKAVRDFAEGKVALESLPALLEKNLNISEKVANQIAKDLEKTILLFIKRGPIEKEKKERPEIPQPEEKLPEKPGPPKRDVYREDVE